MKNHLLFFLCILSTASIAQSSWLPFSTARSESMGGMTLFFQDINSAFGNQAGLANLEKWQTQAGAQQRFGLSDLNTVNGAFAYPTKSGTYAVSFHQFGFEAFKQQKIALAYARKILENLSIGAQFDYLNTQISEYGNKGLMTFELGLQAKIGEEVMLAAHTFSPIRVEVLEEEYIPTLLRMGIAYQPNAKVLVGLAAEKEIQHPLTMKLGLEYQIAKPLVLRIGGASNPTLFSAGLGLKLKNGLELDLGSSMHQYLGISPSVGVRFAGK